jgi:hypothetical protein
MDVSPGLKTAQNKNGKIQATSDVSKLSAVVVFADFQQKEQN